MSQRSPAAQPSSPDKASRRRLVTLVALTLLVVAILGMLLRGRPILAEWTREAAAREIREGGVSRAEPWLAWSRWLDPSDGRTELMQAACFRLQQHERGWEQAVQAAEQKRAPRHLIQQEIDLALIRAGRIDPNAEQEQLAASMAAGKTASEVVTAFVYGYLRRQQPERAKTWLDALADEFPEAAEVAYLQGIYWRWHDNRPQAREQFVKVLAIFPGHELARSALAEMAEEQDLLPEALAHYVEMATCSPRCEAAVVGIARVLRKMGRAEESRQILAPLAASERRGDAAPSLDLFEEMGHIELELGSYAAATRWFARVDAPATTNAAATSAALTPSSLESGDRSARRLFADADAMDRRSKRRDALTTRLTIDADDSEAARELQRLAASAKNAADTSSRDLAATPAQELYEMHCSSCHGANGDGNGRAARHLFPRPRNLRSEPFRLVSTRNGFPTLDDLERVIELGIPGTSMPPFKFLTQPNRRQLAQEVLRIVREAARDAIVEDWSAAGVTPDADELRRWVQQSTEPGDEVQAPQIDTPDPQAIARGRKTFLRLGCNQCHGDEGIGAATVLRFDNRGLPTRSRNLAHDPFKGGEHPESIFLRISVGMPGTVHPASSTVPESEIVDLVHYCRSLSQAPKRRLTNHQRFVLASTRGQPLEPPTPDPVAGPQ